MTDISREEALAHFGVKGQKWGVRNERRANAAKALVDSKKQKIERGKQARENRPRPFKNASPETKKKAAIGAGAVVAAGAAVTAAVLLRKANLNAKDLLAREKAWVPVTEESIKKILAERGDEVAYWTEKFTNLPD